MEIKKNIFVVVGFVLLSSATFFVYKKTLDEKFVTFTEQNSYVSGRHEYTSDGASFSQSGTNLTFATNTEHFSVLIENNSISKDTATNWFSVLLNNTYHSSLYLKPGKRLYSIDMPQNDTTVNFITFVKSTESFLGEVTFYGVELPRSAHCKKIDPDFFDRILKIQFIGNSMTCGYGDMVSIPGPPEGNPLVDFNPYNENAYTAYAMKTAQNLNALATLVSYSGIGLYRNFDADTNETMPKIYDRIHLQKKDSPLWDHTKQKPDIIVINLGTNDYYEEANGKFIDDSVFVQTYIRFVSRLIKLYPDAKIICANGSMMSNDFPENRKCWSRIQNNIKVVKNHFKGQGGEKVYSFFFAEQKSPYGENYHPSPVTHGKMAKELTTFIKTVVNK